MKSSAPGQGGSEGAAVGSAGTSAGAALGAVMIAGCCAGPALGPLIVALFGVSGAVALAGLKPYTPFILAASGAMLAFSFWTTYRPGRACAVSTPRTFAARISRPLLWVSAIVWIASIALTVSTTRGA